MGRKKKRRPANTTPIAPAEKSTPAVAPPAAAPLVEDHAEANALSEEHAPASSAAETGGAAPAPEPSWERLEQSWLVLFHVAVWGAALAFWLSRGGTGALELEPARQAAAQAEARPAGVRAEAAAAPVPSPRAPRPLVDVNHAPAPELALLPGVGETLADRIVAHRRRKGPFTRLDQLLDVPGLGPKTLQRLKGLVVPLPVAGGEEK